MTEKIPYLRDLGVTVVELLPVHQFDPQEGNYWGYMTLHFTSPHQQYAHGEAFEEFRAMVHAFHAAGGDDDLYVMINGLWEDRAFTVVEGRPSEWQRVVDTALPSPEDIVEPGRERKLDSAKYLGRARSVVVLRLARRR